MSLYNRFIWIEKICNTSILFDRLIGFDIESLFKHNNEILCVQSSLCSVEEMKPIEHKRSSRSRVKMYVGLWDTLFHGMNFVEPLYL